MKKLLLFSFLVLIWASSASAQYFEWANSHKGAVWGHSVAAGGNIVAAIGQFDDSVTIGGQTFTSPDSSGRYLAAYDLSGNVLWARQIVSHGIFPIVTVDAGQNIFIAGAYSDSLHIGSLIFKGTPQNNYGVYVAKFNAAGTLLWARSSDLTQTAAPIPTSLSADANGNIFVAGETNRPVTFGNTTLGSPFGSWAYLLKYDPNGMLKWAVTPSSTGTPYQFNPKVKVAVNGEIYFAYKNYSTVAQENGAKINKLNANGSLIWSRFALIPTAPGTSGFHMEHDLATDLASNAYFTGTTNQAVAFTNNGGNTIQLPSSIMHSIFLAKISPSGNWKWARPLSTTNSSTITPSIFFNPNNELAVSGAFTGTATFIPGQPLTSPLNGLNTFIVALDTAGTARWSNQVTSSALSNNGGNNLTGDAKGNYYLSGFFETGSATFNNHTLTTTAVWRQNYLAKIGSDANQVNGTVFMDLNGNGTKDAGERPYQDLMLETTPLSYRSITGFNGNYYFYLPASSYSITIPTPPRHYTFTPATQTVTFPGTNQVLSNKDFALQPISNQPDVKITVTNHTQARPGRELKYRISYRNTGTTVLSDSISLSYNSTPLTYVSATATPAVQQAGLVKWTYQNLQPNELREIVVTLNVSTSAQQNLPLQAVAIAKPFSSDQFLADNRDTLNHLVVASFDPNDKQVNKPFLSVAEATAGTILDYTIRFQNTGNDTAFTVVVTDPISSKLKVSDLEMVSASHPYSLSISNDNLLEWRFNNILLPDSNRNEPASHGFIRFRIKSKPGLATTDSITNQAAIYFDYNAPVMTNYAVTKVANPLGIKPDATVANSFNLYPNPASNFVTVEANTGKPGIAEISLMNILGQTVKKVSLPTGNQIRYELPVGHLQQGVYLVRLKTGNTLQTKRLVIQ